VTFEFDDYSSVAEADVRDDNPGNDTWSSTSVDWNWGPPNTDGGAWRGILNPSEDRPNVTVNPNFKNGIEEWVLIGRNEDGELIRVATLGSNLDQ